MKTVEKSFELGGRKLTLSTGKWAQQATMSIRAQYGETVVLATVVASPMKVELDYFPLSVEYQERLYAGGRIKGSRWVKREGKASDDEILKGRLIDRSIRPLFPKDYKADVQVIITVLSVDMENDPIYVAPLAVSALLTASPIPFQGPVGVLNIGLREESYFINPRDSEIPFSELDLTVSATKDAIIMIEAGAKQVSEEQVLKGIFFAQEEMKPLFEFIEDFAKEVGHKKFEFSKAEGPSDELKKKVSDLVGPKLAGIIKAAATKEGTSNDLENAKAEILENIQEDEAKLALAYFEELYKKEVRSMILSGERPDGRKHTEIRPLSSEVGVLPRTHGSAVFTRGATQALSVTTLGPSAMGQLIETAEGEEEKRYIHHYSMPPYSTGETGRVGSPSRREIGHGALAERALSAVIPSAEVFPYAIRVVSEILSSNGSTSMASTCGSTLSLMDAGVPIMAPVSGIAMGLVIENAKNIAILSDIAGIEDFNGDMDFKVAGTEKGITALQLDVKTLNLTFDILKEAVAQAKIGRQFILESMLATIAEPRITVSNYAPKIKTIRIDEEKIGGVIGSGGKTIKKLMSDTGTQIDIEDDGTVSISGLDESGVSRAQELIESLTKDVEIGEIYNGTVKRIQQFGVFVEFLPGKEGLVRIGDMSTEYVNDPGDVVKEGQEVQVRVKEIDDMHRVNLSMILDPNFAKPNSGGDRHRMSSNSGRGSYNRRPSRERSSESDGPHFPASRLLSPQKKGGFRR